MSQPDSSDKPRIIPDSTYPPLQPPGEFKSQIPHHLMNDASEAERYIMDQLSILQQYCDWSVKASMVIDSNLRLTNGRLRRAEAEIAENKEEKEAKKEGVKLVLKGWRLLAAVAGGLIAVGTVLFKIYIFFKNGG